MRITPDLVVVAGNGSVTRVTGTSLLPFEGAPPEYTAGNDLQIVEVVFDGGEELIDAIYASLWQGGDDA